MSVPLTGYPDYRRISDRLSALVVDQGGVTNTGSFDSGAISCASWRSTYIRWNSTSCPGQQATVTWYTDSTMTVPTAQIVLSNTNGGVLSQAFPNVGAYVRVQLSGGTTGPGHTFTLRVYETELAPAELFPLCPSPLIVQADQAITAYYETYAGDLYRGLCAYNAALVSGPGNVEAKVQTLTPGGSFTDVCTTMLTPGSSQTVIVPVPGSTLKLSWNPLVAGTFTVAGTLTPYLA